MLKTFSILFFCKTRSLTIYLYIRNLIVFLARFGNFKNPLVTFFSDKSW